jgi:signal transduction histidine kinase
MVWATALGIALFQVIGSFGAAHNQPDRKAVGALALLLIVAGPAALAWRDRFPLGAAAVAVAAADVYVACGYPYGPIFVSVAVGLFVAVQAGRRRATWALATAGYAGFVVAHLVDPRAGSSGLLHLALVAGWLVVVLAVSEVVRTRRDQAAQRERVERDERQRRVDEERLRLAQDLHDVLAHNISLINVQASVALHLLDDDPEQARPALATIKEVSKDALHELRTALDLLRRGGADDEAPRSPTPRLADLDALIAGVRSGGFDGRGE